MFPNLSTKLLTIEIWTSPYFGVNYQNPFGSGLLVLFHKLIKST